MNKSPSAMSTRTTAMTINEDKEQAPCLSPEGCTPRRRRRWTLDVLMALWGAGGWLGVHALFVQLPLLVGTAPERWALPAAMALAVQLANAGPLLYAACLRRVRSPPKDAPLITALLAFGAVSLLLASQLYNVTFSLSGTPRSLPFLALTWCVALVGCTGTVLFYPYLRHYREEYVTTFVLGEGLSGLVPSVLALVQGVGGEARCEGGQAVVPAPRYNSGVFLAVCGVVVACSGAAFVLLERLPTFTSERVPAAAAAKGEEAAARARLCSPRWLALLSLAALLSALLNGVLPAVQSYACLPYGARAYHLAAALGAAAAPAACLAGVWLPRGSAGRLLVVVLLSLLPTTLLLTTALSGRALIPGAAVPVVAWVLAVSLISYSRLWLCNEARSGGGRAMRALAGCTQLGAAVASALMFVLVSYTSLFSQPAPCQQALTTVIANATMTTPT